jgi:hypothetical protein
MKLPSPLSKTGLIVGPPVGKKNPIKRAIYRIKSPKPISDKLKRVSPRVSSARSNKSSIEREKFSVFAKNVYVTKEVLNEKKKVSIAEDSTRAESKKVISRPPKVASRKKLEGLKLLQPHP